MPSTDTKSLSFPSLIFPSPNRNRDCGHILYWVRSDETAHSPLGRCRFPCFVLSFVSYTVPSLALGWVASGRVMMMHCPSQLDKYRRRYLGHFLCVKSEFWWEASIQQRQQQQGLGGWGVGWLVGWLGWCMDGWDGMICGTWPDALIKLSGSFARSLVGCDFFSRLRPADTFDLDWK